MELAVQLRRRIKGTKFWKNRQGKGGKRGHGKGHHKVVQCENLAGNTVRAMRDR
jgi:hypothetical protein